MNIILVVSDTFRRDHLPCYGNTSVLTPHLDNFSKDALIFEDFYPTSFPTVPARADLMTGRYTFVYLPWGPMPQNEVTMADCLNKAGYNTAAVADTPFLTRRGYGHDRGFKDFVYVRGQLDGSERDYLHLQRPFSEENGYCAAKTFKEAADWLQRHHKEQFFLYVDTWDPHEPWDPPDYYVKPYYPEYNGEVISPNYWDYKADGYTELDMALARACYQGEISMVDHWFGYFMERVRVLGLLEDTVIIFMSDHGFYFGEHGLFGKRRFRWPDGSNFEEGFSKGMTVDEQIVYRSPLHNEVTQVPLMIHLPGTAGRRVPGLVSIPDLMPTILEMAGAPIPERVQARSILPMIEGQANTIHDLLVTSAPLEEAGQLTKTVDDQAREVMELSPASISNGEWDMLYSVNGQRTELYRTREDPAHQNNRIDDEQAVAADLHQQYVAWLESIGTSEKYLAPRRKL